MPKVRILGNIISILWKIDAVTTQHILEPIVSGENVKNEICANYLAWNTLF